MENNNDLVIKYIEFIKLINNKNDNLIDIINDEESIKSKTNKYYTDINSNSKFKKYLIDRKIKLFYSDNVKLFDNINIRKIIEKVDEITENKIWTYLQLFYILNDDKNGNTTLKLIEQIEEDLHDNKSDKLINDIIESIKELFSNLNENENPLEKIISLSNDLSNKYSKDIEEGNITIEELTACITNYVKENGMNFGDFSNLDLSKDKILDMFKNILSEEQLESIMNLSNLNFADNIPFDLFSGDLFKNLINNNIKKEINDKPLEEDELSKMEKYFKNISTDDISTNNVSTNDVSTNDVSTNDVSLEKENILNEKETEDNNISEMLFKEFNNINKNLNTDSVDSLLNEDNLGKLEDLKNNLMNKLTSEQKSEINNLTNSLLKGFNLNN